MFKRKKSPTDLVKSVHKHLQQAEQKHDYESGKHSSKDTKTFEKISASLKAMRVMLYGDDPEKKNAAKLAEEILDHEAYPDLPLMMIKHIPDYDFEAQKDVERVFSYLLRNGKNSVQYFIERDKIQRELVDGYRNPDIALHCGPILRECLRHQELCERLIESDDFKQFFSLVQDPNFDIAADAFETFKIMLTQHKTLCARFLESKYDEIIIGEYNTLIQSDNYVTRRQSLKLLGEILLDRENFKIMMRYINDPANLKIMMNLLRERSAIIQFEAFHVFKVFVANPKKSTAVLEILYRNREKLIDFLQKFQQDKDDEQFIEEKNILLSTLKTLENPADRKNET